MFFISNDEQSDYKIYEEKYKELAQIGPDGKKTGDLINANPLLDELFMDDYPLQYPLTLNYYTYKSDDTDVALIGTNIDPEQFVYYTQDKTCADLIQSKIKLHRHNFYELMFIFDGEVHQTIEHSRHYYPKGCACLMNKNVHHKEEYSAYSRVVFLKFSEELIFSLLNSSSIFNSQTDSVYHKIRDFFDYDAQNQANKSYIDFAPVGISSDSAPIKSNESRKNNRIYHLFDEISMLLYEHTPLASVKISALFYEMLYIFFDENYYSPTPIRIGTAKQRDLFDQIEKYVHKNKGRVSRNDLEKKFNYSGDYLYRIIGKYTGMSISDYCLSISMQYAADMLTSTSKTAQEICTELGFTNKTQFYNAFKKKYGVTPKAYKKSH